MFLSKKGFWKIMIMAICYFILGTFLIVIASICALIGLEYKLALILGIFMVLMIAPIICFGRYAEGKGKLINMGNKLVRNDLKPAEFINEYNTLKNSTNLMINKPSFEVLHLLAVAYESLRDYENTITIVNEMIEIAPKKKKTLALIIKTSILFSNDKNEEAEALFQSLQGVKLDALSYYMLDSVLKSDRAQAKGDYKVAETYNLTLLSKSFPKLDALGKLFVHNSLAEIYLKLEEIEKAKEHYQYCVEFGGETAIKTNAIIMLEKLH